jgi:lipopolysaccharide transport system ATP-binding protein
MGDIAIHTANLSKRYRLGPHEPYLALRDVLAKGVKAPFRLFSSVRIGHPSATADFIWALKDVCLEVKHGEIVGIIGRNGTGKSTLLKVLTRITHPTSGYAQVWGRVGSLLEVGTGFHPELTGRENIYLSGSILGMTKVEITRRFDEIVAFAGVERFLDTAAKHYSSGMYMRLAFAVAAHLEPDVLLVDEVLAVGDLEFQRKCLGKMESVSQTGRTVLFVSHQMNQIRRLCSQVIWMDAGGIRKIGPTADVVGAYETATTSGHGSEARAAAASDVKARFIGWKIEEPSNENPHLLTSVGPVTVKFTVQVNRPLRMGHHGVALYDYENRLMWARAANNLELEVGNHGLYYSFPMLPLRPGIYSWHVSVYDEHGLVDVWFCSPEMTVGTENYQHPADRWSGVLNMPSQFTINGTGRI